MMAKLKRNDDIVQYTKACDERFKVRTDFNLLF